MLDKETAHAVALEVVKTCRADVDRELEEIRALIHDHTLTPEKVKHIASLAAVESADLAVQKITDNFYMGVGRKTLIVLGATVVVTWDQLREIIKKAAGL